MKNLSLFATLALAMALSPSVFAQQDQSSQPNPNAQTHDASADTQTQSFSGTVVKAKNHYVLKTDRLRNEQFTYSPFERDRPAVRLLSAPSPLSYVAAI
jgi:hypothetical protein